MAIGDDTQSAVDALDDLFQWMADQDSLDQIIEQLPTYKKVGYFKDDDNYVIMDNRYCLDLIDTEYLDVVYYYGEEELEDGTVVIETTTGHLFEALDHLGISYTVHLGVDYNPALLIPEPSQYIIYKVADFDSGEVKAFKLFYDDFDFESAAEIVIKGEYNCSTVSDFVYNLIVDDGSLSPEYWLYFDHDMWFKDYMCDAEFIYLSDDGKYVYEVNI